KVPLIVCDPGGRLGLERGARAGQVVELRDIMPTLLDAAGADIPDTVDGASLLPLCRGTEAGTDADADAAAAWWSYIHGEHVFGDRSNQFATDGQEKYIWFSQTGEEQFFDLRSDPGECVNLAGRP